MKTLQEIKEQVAFEYGWKGLLSDSKSITECPKLYIDEVSRRFATEVAKEALDNAYESTKDTLQEFAFKREGQLSKCLSESILSKTNIPKL